MTSTSMHESTNPRSWARLFGLCAPLLLVGCASAPAMPISKVAQGDLECGQVSVDEVAENRFQANGCGKTGTYAQLCSGRHCSWVRVRSPGEQQTASAGGSTAPRELIPAPPPQPREIIPAPAPAQREIIPAPPPEAQADTSSPANVTPTNTAPVNNTAGATAQGAPAAGPAPAPTAEQLAVINAKPEGPPASNAPAVNSLQPYTPQGSPLAQGSYSQPYQTEVPSTVVAQRTEYPPPAPLYETRPPAPRNNYIWINGYWWWNTPNWVWAPGYWSAPRLGFSYVPSSWYWASGYWWFGPGGWARPGSTYIVAGVGPRPYRYVTSRAFSPRSYAVGPGGRMGVGPSYSSARAPARFGAQPSPLYRYPTASSPSRMGSATMRSGGYPSSLGGPARMGSGSMGSPTRYGSMGRYDSMPGPSRFGSGSMGGPARSPSSSFRSAPMMRMPSSGGGGGFNRMGGGGGGFGRMGGGGGGGFGRMGGGGGGAPHRSAGGR